MSRLEIMTPQPNFPNEDLDASNIAMVEFYLHEHHEATTHARHLRESMRPLHLTAHYALQQAGVEVEYTPEEYEAFCKGFAAFEYMSLMVNPRHIRQRLVARNVMNLLTSSEAIPEIEMADRRQAWMDVYANANGVITDTGIREGETLPELHSRSIGAQIACELQMVA